MNEGWPHLSSQEQDEPSTSKYEEDSPPSSDSLLDKLRSNLKAYKGIVRKLTT